MLITLRGEGLKRLIQSLSWFRMKELCSKVFLIFPSLPIIIIMSKDMAFFHILYKYSQLGKSEEQLPQKTVGRLLVNSRLTVGQQLANSRPTVGQQSAHSFSFTAFYENLLPTVGRLSANCWQHVGNLLAKCRVRTPVEYQKSFSSQGRTLHIDAK